MLACKQRSDNHIIITGSGARGLLIGDKLQGCYIGQVLYVEQTGK